MLIITYFTGYVKLSSQTKSFKYYYFIFFQVSTDELRLERLGFMYRAYIALKKFRVVLDETETSKEPLRPLRLLAEYFAYPQKRLVKLLRCVNKPLTLQLCLCFVYLLSQKPSCSTTGTDSVERCDRLQTLLDSLSSNNILSRGKS